MSEARLGLPVGFPQAHPGVNLTPRTVLSISAGSSPKLSPSFKDVSSLLPAWQRDTAAEEDETTITRHRTTDQTTDRDRVGQTEEFLIDWDEHCEVMDTYVQIYKDVDKR